MAVIQVQKESRPTKIERFLGINEDTSGDTQIQLGESPDMLNYRITEKYKLRKREGYEELFPSLGNHDIQGMWHGKITGTYWYLFAMNGQLYNHDLTTGTNTVIGSLNDEKVHFFNFNNKVYILDGHEYKSFNGTTLENVKGYRPIIATVTPPAGGGVPNEQINLLTGAKEQWFSPDGTAKDFQLAETELDSVDFVKNQNTGLTYIEGTDYTKNLTTGKISFMTAPLGGTPDSVSIGWTKGAGSRDEVVKHRFSMFYGGANDTRVFFYGNGTNRYIYTGLADGVPSAEYFPPFNRRDISTDEYQVTDIIRQYDRQIIYTNGGETHYSYYDPIHDVAGNVIADFPTFPLNGAIGNVSYGQVQLIENNPFSIQNGVHEWVATNVRDERNAVHKSKRVQPSLDMFDLTEAITVDWEVQSEYWLAIGDMVWVYNYRLDVWYRFKTSHKITCFLVVENVLHIGTKGQIMRFGRTETSDNGTIIDCRWEMNFYDFDAEYLRKFLTEMWISLKPESKCSVDITYQTDRNARSQTYTATYNLSTFVNADFGSWSFLINYNPQPFRFKIKAKKFTYLKLILSNNKEHDILTVLSINLPVRFGSKVK